MQYSLYFPDVFRKDIFEHNLPKHVDDSPPTGSPSDLLLLPQRDTDDHGRGGNQAREDEVAPFIFPLSSFIFIYHLETIRWDLSFTKYV